MQRLIRSTLFSQACLSEYILYIRYIVDPGRVKIVMLSLDNFLLACMKVQVEL